MMINEDDLYKILKNRGPVVHYNDLKERLSMIHPFKLSKMLVKLMHRDKVAIGTTGGNWYVVIREEGDIFDAIEYMN